MTKAENKEILAADNTVGEQPAVLSGQVEPTTIPGDDLTTDLELLSGLPLEEITTTQETEADYDILIQGSDRKYPAIVIRRKHRGQGATIRTISKNGQHKALYDDYAEAIAAYQRRREDRRKNVVGKGSDESKPANPREARIDKAIQDALKRSDNSSGDSDRV